MVAGHSKCGAVTAAFEGGEFSPALASLIDMIHLDCVGAADVDQAIRNHIAATVYKIRGSETLAGLGVKVVGAYYDIETGRVTWTENQ